MCGEPRFEDPEIDTLLNPTLIVAVLSRSTEDYDRGGKFEHYRTLASLQEYVLIAQERYHIVHYGRQPDDTWVLSETRRPEGSVRLPSIDCVLLVAEVYQKVNFLDQ